MYRLNVGCGNQRVDGFVGVDIELGDAAEIACDICYLRLIQTESVDAIYSAHALQCLPDRSLVPTTLASWFRVLRPGGTLNIEVPDSKPLLREYLSGRIGAETVIQGIYGVNEPGLRQTLMFDWVYLHDLLFSAGFSNIHEGPQACYSRHDARTNLVVYCQKPA